MSADDMQRLETIMKSFSWKSWKTRKSDLGFGRNFPVEHDENT